MAAARRTPPVDIPPSITTVEISIIDTTSFMSGFPAKTFVEPLVPGFDTMNTGSYAFLIKHDVPGTKYHTVVFDLGVRKDWEDNPPDFVAGIRASGGSDIQVERDVATILLENGQSLEEVGAIIWSHWHFDHVGDPQTFPTTTDLIVGPGFKANFVPGHPTVPSALVDERAWHGRKLHEIDFTTTGDSKTLQIGSFNAYDFFGDGSFFLLSSPGHAIGHMSALARTTADPPTFILLGGDIAHHCGQFRPTPYNPMPDLISPSPFGHLAPPCPGSIYLAIHPKRSAEEPFFYPVASEPGWHHDPLEARESIAKLMEADAYDNIFPVMAHDMSLQGVVDFYPKRANEWLAKGWKEKSRWRFLSSFVPIEDVSDYLPSGR